MPLSRDKGLRAIGVILLTVFGLVLLSVPLASANFYMVVYELNRILCPIQGSSPAFDDSDLAIFSDLGNVKVLGLGEATHGTKEFFEMKHRIFRYFVTNHGTRIFGFECDFAESIYLDRYVTTGEGNLKSLMSSKMHFWTWHTEEVMALLEWMRAYNDGRPEEDKIHYFGFDCQYTDLHVPLLREYILKFLPAVPLEIEAVLAEIQALTTSSYQTMESSRRDALIAKLAVVDDVFVSHEAEACAALGELDFHIARQLVRTASQAIEVTYAVYQGGFYPRDNYMAENVLRLRELLPGDVPMVAWAHNGHIAKDAYYYGTGTNKQSMGYFLHQALGKDYQAVGFSFNGGSFMAFGPYGFGVQAVWQDPPITSYNHLFNYHWKGNFILRFDRLNPEGSLMIWMRPLRPLLVIGAKYNSYYFENYFRIIPLLDHFDFIIHFNHTHYAVQLSRN